MPIQSPALTDREIGAGTDPATGFPMLHLDGLDALGFEAPDQRYLLFGETASKVGAQLLFAGEPELAAELLKELAHRAQRRKAGARLPEIPAGVAAFVVDPGLVPFEAQADAMAPGSLLKVEGLPYAFISPKASGLALLELRAAIDAELAKRRQNAPQEAR